MVSAEPAARVEVEAHDHHVFVYDDPSELLGALGAFLERAHKGNAIAVFVHSFPSERAAVQFAEQAYLPAKNLLNRQVFLVQLYRDAFETAGRIDHDHVGRVVSGLIERAEADGGAGVRVFVDASTRYFEMGRVEEWFAFESFLGRRLAAEIGLVCAYRASDIEAPAMLDRVHTTHQYRFTP